MFILERDRCASSVNVFILERDRCVIINIILCTLYTYLFDNNKTKY